MLTDFTATMSHEFDRRQARKCGLTSFAMPTTNLFDLSGCVAVITGGNGGIGRSIDLGLAQAGDAIAVLARNEEKNQRVMSELQPLELP